jgi:hypothetical protein
MKTKISVLFLPVVITALLLIPYTLLYIAVNHDDNDDHWILIAHIAVFAVTMAVFRLIDTALDRYFGKPIKEYFSIGESLVLLVLFLFVSSVLINPVTFLFLIVPINRNLFLHLFILLLAPLLRAKYLRK